MEQVGERPIFELMSERAKGATVEASFELTSGVVADTKIGSKGIE